MEEAGTPKTPRRRGRARSRNVLSTAAVNDEAAHNPTEAGQDWPRRHPHGSIANHPTSIWFRPARSFLTPAADFFSRLRCHPPKAVACLTPLFLCRLDRPLHRPLLPLGLLGNVRRLGAPPRCFPGRTQPLQPRPPPLPNAHAVRDVTLFQSFESTVRCLESLAEIRVLNRINVNCLNAYRFEMTCGHVTSHCLHGVVVLACSVDGCRTATPVRSVESRASRAESLARSP